MIYKLLKRIIGKKVDKMEKKNYTTRVKIITKG